MFQIKGDKKLKVMPSPRLDPILEGKKCYKEHYLVNWLKWDVDDKLKYYTNAKFH